MILRDFAMLTQQRILHLLRENHPYLASEYGVCRIGLFGSFVKGQPDETSDIDLVVEFDRPIGFRVVEFAEYLERLLGRKVDLLTTAGIQGIRVVRVSQDIRDTIVYV